MFDNILGQPVTERIKNDLLCGLLPPSILFSGEEASAKGSSALELARVLNCAAPPDGAITKNTALWNCKCGSCARHKLLASPDLIVTGPKNFIPEIKAAESVFLKNPESVPCKVFFIRACKKLLLRFSPVLWEDDPKISKLNKILEDINEDLEDFGSFSFEKDEKGGESGDGKNESGVRKQEKLKKILNSITDNAQKLESEGISETIPVSHIRAASSWLRLTPNGKKKILIIENAEKMNDAAKNSLLKILEEPPETACIILTSAKPDTLLPTILSRVRPYIFSRRGAGMERDIIKRIFRDEPGEAAEGEKNFKGNLIVRYLDKFLPVQSETMYPVAAFFLASVAALAIARLGRTAVPYPLFARVGEYCSAVAEKAGLPRYAKNIKETVTETRRAAGKFEAKRLFGVFLEKLCVLFSESTAGAQAAGLPSGALIYYRGLLKEKIEESRIAVEIYNQQTEAALERLCSSLLL